MILITKLFETLNKKQLRKLVRILITATLLCVLQFIPCSGMTKALCYFVPYLIIAADILRSAGHSIRNRRVFDENFLMAVASLGAFVLAFLKTGDYIEAVAVALFYQTGELFESIAVGRSRKNITELMDIRPDYANVMRDGAVVSVDPEEVSIGSEIIIRPGEKVPIDGIILSGSSTLNSSALTGESLPREIGKGDEILSGCINLSGVLHVRTTKEFGESTVSRILNLVENASSRKSHSEEFISKFARVYTPFVCYSALALAVLPPLVRFFLLSLPAMPAEWFYRALTFLVISCPCALVISIPLTFFAGLGGASREGVLIKGSNFMETLAKTETVVFDKTGTLTQGVFEVSDIHHSPVDRKTLLEYAALAESASSHPISKSLRRAYGLVLNLSRVRDITEFSGEGVTALVDGKQVAAGNERLMKRLGIDFIHCTSAGSIVHMVIDGKYCGHIVISDVLKADAVSAVKSLKKCGMKNIVMLTGDNHTAAEVTARELNIETFYSDLLPGDKVERLEALMNQFHGKLAFVGDGINDAPVLSRADIGIAMGAAGSDAAIEAADVVLMDDAPMKIPHAVKIARKCLRIVHENICGAIGVKVAVLILGAFGLANLWLAVFADVGVMILAVLNAGRALFVHNL